MHRLYDNITRTHVAEHEEMLFFAGPRQVGKTTISQAANELTESYYYYNWDDQDDRDAILNGPKAIAEQSALNRLLDSKPLVAFDEIHKYQHWKTFLKGLYDRYHSQTGIIVTGSSRLDIYKKGGDSLMGRYFPYRVHPLSLAECVRTSLAGPIVDPTQPDSGLLEALIQFGGFPKPFIKQNAHFSTRWRKLRYEQLIREDIRDLSLVQELAQLEILSLLIREQVGQLTTYTSLSKKIRVSVDTIRRWISLLESFYYCYVVKPWTKNVTRSLLKEPKIYLWDWSGVKDIGTKRENFIASHLLKATHFWTDMGYGDFGLYFLRDHIKREVDFVVTRDDHPWFLVEVKSSNNHHINPNLEFFQEQIGATHAFQIAFDLPYVDRNCFEVHEPVIVPVETFLSQLV